MSRVASMFAALGVSTGTMYLVFQTIQANDDDEEEAWRERSRLQFRASDRYYDALLAGAPPERVEILKKRMEELE